MPIVVLIDSGAIVQVLLVEELGTFRAVSVAAAYSIFNRFILRTTQFRLLYIASDFACIPETDYDKRQSE